VAIVSETQRLPAIYIPHGGGPWPFVDLPGFVEPREKRALADYLAGLVASLPRRPAAMVVVSAHWEATVPTVMTSPSPPILYDYYGFPPASYEITWPAPGNPRLAARVRELLEGAGVPTAEDAKRGFDHGTFIPLKLTFPDADVPTIQLSLQEGLDPARHLAIGRALAPLRGEGVLLVGSGMSYHNMRGFRQPQGRADSEVFDAWMQHVAASEPGERDAALARWSEAPAARRVHPREEHLLPLMVMAGAAGADRGRVPFSDSFGGVRISAVHFGA
jgi:aromatic ring-opening dioxygenase catalytic subunit (LigB family)